MSLSPSVDFVLFPTRVYVDGPRYCLDMKMSGGQEGKIIDNFIVMANQTYRIVAEGGISSDRFLLPLTQLPRSNHLLILSAFSLTKPWSSSQQPLLHLNSNSKHLQYVSRYDIVKDCCLQDRAGASCRRLYSKGLWEHWRSSRSLGHQTRYASNNIVSKR